MSWTADELKNLGNASFTHKNYDDAIEHFTGAIEMDPSNHVLFSNRSAAYAMKKQFSKALDDATRCVALGPKFVKGYSRKGFALMKMGNYQAAIDTYTQGLYLDGSNKALIDGLTDARVCLQNMLPAKPAGGDKVDMADPLAQEYMMKLLGNPDTADLLKDPEVIKILQDVTANPNNLANYMGNPKVKNIMEAMMAMQGQAPPNPDAPAEEPKVDAEPTITEEKTE
jgi:stress-induced-phosphoprotein 1